MSSWIRQHCRPAHIVRCFENGSPFAIAARIDRQALRFRTLSNVIGWACFVIITADYAGFIDLPPFLAIPLWLGVILNIFRWGIWEAMVKPHIPTRADLNVNQGSKLPDRNESQ